MWAKAMLQEFCSAWGVFSAPCPVERQQWSLWARPGICSAPEQWKGVFRSMAPQSSAADMVSTLKVEPGS